MSLKETLVAAVKKYIGENDSLFSFFKGMGTEGKLRAQDYLRFLNETDLEDESLYQRVFMDVLSQLGTSTYLRIRLAEALCEYRQISPQKIEDDANSIFSRHVSWNGVVIKSYEKCRTEAMLILLGGEYPKAGHAVGLVSQPRQGVVY